ncbi:tRNA (guanine(6)-N(2))-methyltransferase THUMP3 [Amia ocellicauda]|uniref:tRNA (guanine(6)-N(2))-methyltransferase THUMP3 n=1 Tax=Amia ocellicauda TaxID=2972642 RepID=UPI0034646D81|nr:THUM3 protein [Amia calva]
MSTQQEEGIGHQCQGNPQEDSNNTALLSHNLEKLTTEQTTDPISVTIGATVPTGFELTAAEEIKEKIGADARISKDRGRIYFKITLENLPQLHHLKSVDNLFVVVEEFSEYEFKDTKEETLEDFQTLAAKLPWTCALEVWKMNNSLKKKRTRRKMGKEAASPKGAPDTASAENCNAESPTAIHERESLDPKTAETGNHQEKSKQDEEVSTEVPELDNDCEVSEEEESSKLLKFRVTCNRAGEKHNFTSNDAARDFGGAVQDFFQWKADMTKFDIEVLLNIHNTEVVIGIALTEESLHRRNITHFGPTTLRSTLAYGMLRLCKPQMSDVVIDPMCGTGAIPLEGAIEWPYSYYVAGDNNGMAVNRTVNNINHIHKKRQNKKSTAWGLCIDTVQWDLCNLPVRTGSVDIIVTDMPFGKRMGSKKKNWDLYPSCLKEMGRVCRPGTGKAVLLTQDKKCFAKALSKMGYLWRKSQTVWVNVGGLHAAVYLLKRTGFCFSKMSEEFSENKDLVDEIRDEEK